FRGVESILEDSFHCRGGRYPLWGGEVMLKEYGVRWAVSTNLAIIAIAILVGGTINHLLRLFV
ncbi:hypothetical protein, partial [Candidatus Magnetaquicoccus inordinatus]|uniref:hypothetical protein n=1 Tax=Candidatus Magnetaquicoccus inordinatus TaxID=2496818 RepID=UPI001D0E2C3C